MHDSANATTFQVHGIQCDDLPLAMVAGWLWKYFFILTELA